MKKIYPIFLVFALIVSCTSRQPQAVKPPLMGWSSWNAYMVDISDSIIMHQANLIVKRGLKDAGYGNVNIDDGFFGYRDQRGYMIPHPQRFPGGSAQMRSISDHIHSLGLKAGIYSDAGDNTCGSQNRDPYGLNVGLFRYEKEDCHTYFIDWNYDFIKVDYCGGMHKNLDDKAQYTKIADAIKNCGRDDIQFNICRWAYPGTWVSDIADSWRTTADIYDAWESVRGILDENLYLSAYCRDGHYNDMDMLEIGRGLSDNEEEVHFGMWCIMSSPLLIGCDLTRLSEASLNLLSNPELIALNQDSLGLQARVVARCGNGYVLAKDIERRHGKVQAVALYNPSDSACHFSVPLSQLGMGGRVSLRNLIRRCDMKPVRDSIVHTLSPRSVLIMRAEATRRIETSHYEAEWAYLPCFDALGKRKYQVIYARNEAASGGMVVSYLGGRPENTARWTDVWSDRGGRYLLTVRYVPAVRRALEISVNGGKPTRLDRLSYTDSMAEVTVPITLHPGYNTIEMGNPYGWAPDIDCFKLSKL